MLAAEFGRVADRISIILPWGSLLRTVAAADIEALRQIAKLCLPDANIEIVFSYDPEHDAGEGARLGIPNLNEQYMTLTLAELYDRAGLHLVAAAKIPLTELARYETTWAKRLASGRSRDVWRIRATCNRQ